MNAHLSNPAPMSPSPQRATLLLNYANVEDSQEQDREPHPLSLR